MMDDFVAVLRRAQKAIDLTPKTSRTAMLGVDDLCALLAHIEKHAPPVGAKRAKTKPRPEVTP